MTLCWRLPAPTEQRMTRQQPLTRRRFLITFAAVSSSGALPCRAFAAAHETRTLSFAHLHTGEKLSLEYYSGGHYLQGALAALNHLLRDFRSGEVASIDPALLDLLHELARMTGSRQPFQIISAYRCVATNEALHRRSAGVASGSLHTSGRAIDIRLGDVAIERLRDAALALRRGGVGYYAASNFVHVDTGRVRAW
jgi:uncharacterized protein YcbK (DUF882 family)